MEKPAIEGGTAVRNEFLPFAKPSISQDEIDAVVDVLKSGWLTTGSKVKKFEEVFGRYTGCKHSIAVNSGTSGLHLALVVLGIKPGDEVILPSFTFAATANVVVHCGGKPVFADIDEHDFGLDPDDVRKKITKKTKAIIPVHYGGQACRIGEIVEIADKHNLHVVEDCAHSIGATYKGKQTGSFGKIAAFSFYATKNITTGEGGMVTTDDEAIANRLEILRLHGMSKEAWKRYGKGGNWQYDIVEAGYKYNLSDMQAALGLVQMKKIDELDRKRREIADYFSKELRDELLVLPEEVRGRKHVWHLYVIRLKLDMLRLDREKFISALQSENIGASVHFIPLHLQPYYSQEFGYKKGMLPKTEKVYQEIVSLPLYPNMTREDVSDVIAAVKKIIKYYKKA